MAYIKEVRGHTPRVGEGTFVAETAVLIGDVTVGRDSSIWFNTVLRGDVNSITVGDRTNIQDGTVIHTLYDGAPHPSQTHIGNDVSIGHNATIHGAIIEDNCLISPSAVHFVSNAVTSSFQFFPPLHASPSLPALMMTLYSCKSHFKISSKFKNSTSNGKPESASFTWIKSCIYVS